MDEPGVAVPAYLPAPLITAPGIPEYPDFRQTVVPENCEAIRAWTGAIRPFVCDEEARNFLYCVEAGRQFDIAAGTVYAHRPTTARHWADPYLVQSNIQFQVLVMEFGGTEHPRAYALAPEISYDAHPLCPHLRGDRILKIGHLRLPALCVYSGAEFRYAADLPRLVQFLDQVTSYLGRHVVWLRTRVMLPQRLGDRFGAMPIDEATYSSPLGFQRDPFVAKRVRKAAKCTGYWPGPAAPTGAEQHLTTIKPDQECWCWSGKRYAVCHRKSDQIMANTSQ